jgi:hypothetical protein
MASDRTEVTTVPLVLACLVRFDPSPFLLGVRVVGRSCVMWMKGSWLTPTLALGLVFLDQLGLDRSGSCWLMYRGPLVLLTNRCLEAPRGYNLDIPLVKLDYSQSHMFSCGYDTWNTSR